jgi:transglutaminase/protease-like cytokinesis protein 3
MKFLLAALLTTTTFFCHAQTEKKYAKVDAYALSVGKLDSLNMGNIAIKLTKPFADKMDKIRALYTWVANNITYDIKAARNDDAGNFKTVDILKLRKANGLGFAKLFQDMCSSIGVRCLTTDGSIRRVYDDLENGIKGINHSWNVIQLGTTADTWHYVDCALASGTWDNDFKVVTKSFSDRYFFTNKATFNKQHIPNNAAWLLGPGTANLKEFNTTPWVRTGAIEFGLTTATPATNIIKTKQNQLVNFKFTLDNADKVATIKIKYGNPKKPKIKDAIFNYNSSVLTFSHKFELADDYPVTILLNDKDLITYKAEIEEVDN